MTSFIKQQTYIYYQVGLLKKENFNEENFTKEILKTYEIEKQEDVKQKQEVPIKNQGGLKQKQDNLNRNQQGNEETKKNLNKSEINLDSIDSFRLSTFDKLENLIIYNENKNS